MGAFTAVKEDKIKKKTNEKKESDLSLASIKLDPSKLPRKERARLFAKEAPEFAGVVEAFGERMLEAAKVGKICRLTLFCHVITPA